MDKLQVISQKIFDGELRDIHEYDTRSKDRLSIDKVNLELTNKRLPTTTKRLHKEATFFY